MKTWKLVSGILSIVLSVIVFFQSAIAGLGNALQENGEVGGTAGLIVSIALLVGGIVSICVRKGSKAGAIALVILFGLGGLLGYSNAGSYRDLQIWSSWCFICAVLAFLSIFMKRKS